MILEDKEQFSVIYKRTNTGKTQSKTTPSFLRSGLQTFSNIVISDRKGRLLSIWEIIIEIVI